MHWSTFRTTPYFLIDKRAELALISRYTRLELFLLFYIWHVEIQQQAKSMIRHVSTRVKYIRKKHSIFGKAVINSLRVNWQCAQEQVFGLSVSTPRQYKESFATVVSDLLTFIWSRATSNFVRFSLSNCSHHLIPNYTRTRSYIYIDH